MAFSTPPGPGHGKALIASYMFANDRALRRGIVMAFLAAILQALVAIALIGVAALIFHATDIGMNRAGDFVEIASYLASPASAPGWSGRKGARSPRRFG